MAKVLGVLVEHEGREYLVATDAAFLPDLLRRDDAGRWITLKHKGPGGRAGSTAREILAGLGSDTGDHHTQHQIKMLVLHCVTATINRFFQAARW